MMKTIILLLLAFLNVKVYSQEKQKLTFERPNHPGDTVNYEGVVINGKANGYGEATLRNKHRYKGYWKDNNYHGKGTIYYAEGAIYEDQWTNGEYSRKGVMTYANGNTYSGQWNGSRMHGKGKYTWTGNNGNNGDVYEGDFDHDAMHGKGTYTWKNGNVYNGDWIKGARTGKGIFTWGSTSSANGDKYNGDFVNGAFAGKGKYTWANGDAYEGDWVNGVRTGIGIFTYADGRKLNGNWANNQYQAPAVQAKPTTSFTEPFEVTFTNGLPKAENSRARGTLLYNYVNSLFASQLSAEEKNNHLMPKIIQLRDIDFYALYECWGLLAKQNEMPKAMLYLKAAKATLTEQQHKALTSDYNMNAVKTSGGAIVYNRTTAETSTIAQRGWDPNLPKPGYGWGKTTSSDKVTYQASTTQPQEQKIKITEAQMKNLIGTIWYRNYGLNKDVVKITAYRKWAFGDGYKITIKTTPIAKPGSYSTSCSTGQEEVLVDQMKHYTLYKAPSYTCKTCNGAGTVISAHQRLSIHPRQKNHLYNYNYFQMWHL